MRTPILPFVKSFGIFILLLSVRRRPQSLVFGCDVVSLQQCCNVSNEQSLISSCRAILATVLLIVATIFLSIPHLPCYETAPTSFRQRSHLPAIRMRRLSWPHSEIPAGYSPFYTD